MIQLDDINSFSKHLRTNLIRGVGSFQGVKFYYTSYYLGLIKGVFNIEVSSFKGLE